jgi:hypothetical protein
MYKFITLNTAWAKNVNNLRVTSGLNSDNLSTNSVLQFLSATAKRGQTLFTNNSLLHNSTDIYTYPNSKFNLLSKTFTHYPQPLLMSPKMKFKER